MWHLNPYICNNNDLNTLCNKTIVLWHVADGLTLRDNGSRLRGNVSRVSCWPSPSSYSDRTITLLGYGMVNNTQQYSVSDIFYLVRLGVTREGPTGIGNLRQMTDPTYHQRGRPAETRQQLSENNLRTESNIWSQAPEWARYLDIRADRPSVVAWLRLRTKCPGV
jgi:hypothetical protein